MQRCTDWPVDARGHHGIVDARIREHRRDFMSTLLALLFAFFSLISLLSVNPTWDTSTSQLGDNPSRMSEVRLRIMMQR